MATTIRSIEVRLPEGVYRGRAVLDAHVDGNLIDIVMRDGIPFRGDDEVYGFYVGGPRKTIAQAVRQLRTEIARDRARYEHRGWRPSAAQVARARREGARRFLSEAG